MNKAILIAVLLVGCAAPETPAPETTIAQPSDLPAEPNATAATEPVASAQLPMTVSLESCREVQSTYTFPAEDYADQMPAGFELALDNGKATILVISRECAHADHHMVSVLVQPPTDLAREEFDHALAMDDVWIEDESWTGLLEAAEISFDERSFLLQGAIHEVGGAFVLTSEPDWVIETNAASPGDDAFHQLRYFGAYYDSDAGSVVATGAIDFIRDEASAFTGTASAHRLPLIAGGLLPFNQDGDARIIHELVDVMVTLV